MHELSVCQNIVQQLEDIAAQHHAHSVSLVKIQLGPLSGIEAPLLAQAFPIASAGTIADGAVLHTEILPITIRCRMCGHEGTAQPNRLVCGACGDWHTQLLSGDEMLLASVELNHTA